MFEVENFQPDPIELAWAAGFFDGEGYVSFRLHNANRNGKYYRRIEVQIGQIDTFVLERFVRAVGRGNVYGPIGLNIRDGRSPLYKMNIAGYRGVKATWTLLMPYLSPVKIEQFQAALKLYEECPVVVSSDQFRYYQSFTTHAAAEVARKAGL